MLKTLTLAAAALVLAAPAFAKVAIDTDGGFVPPTYDKSGATHASGYCQIIVTSAATSLTTLLGGGAGVTCAIPAWAVWAVFTPENSTLVAVRWAMDGTVITSSFGAPIFGYVPKFLPAAGLSSLSLISATGSNVTVDVEFGG